MTHIYDISDDILRKIFYDSDTKTQFTLNQTCRKFNKLPIMCIDKKCGIKITDGALKQYPLLRELNIESNRRITDEGLKHLPLLHTLDASYTKITDEGLKHLPLLHTLHAIFKESSRP